MQDIYRPQGEYRPKRSGSAMIVAASIVGGVGLLVAAAATGNLPFGASESTDSNTQSTLQVAKADLPDAGPAVDIPAPDSVPAMESSVPETTPEAVAPAPHPKAKAPARATAPPAAKQAATERQSSPPVATCGNCGAVESVQAVKADDQTAASTNAAASAESKGEAGDAVSYRIGIRMEDGSLRTVVQEQPPAVAQGDRVRIEHGMVVRGS